MKRVRAVFIFFLLTVLYTQTAHASYTQWDVKSIDTMKFSRDLSRERLGDPRFATEIDKQVQRIAQTGATHVAIGTPYDEEFTSVLEKWVEAARKYHLNVWFRGNFSGWEEWFGYTKIDREQHKKQTIAFIQKHKDLFADGDIFTSCPECENGGPGDPRVTNDVSGHRAFLLAEYIAMEKEFSALKKNVTTGFFSMNADVAKLVMDEQTTKKLGGVVVIDHYVSDPVQLASDVAHMAELTGGSVVLGEFGAPIPDLHGRMTKNEQRVWLEQALVALASQPALLGMNYWTNGNSTTAIWDTDGTPHPAQATLSDFYHETVIKGKVVSEKGGKIGIVHLSGLGRNWRVNKDGTFALPYFSGTQEFVISAPGYHDSTIALSFAQQGQTYGLLVNAEEQITFWGIIPYLQHIGASIGRFLSLFTFTFSL
jgi:hypothetical protein